MILERGIENERFFLLMFATFYGRLAQHGV